MALIPDGGVFTSALMVSHGDIYIDVPKKKLFG
jgi:hypothetical protein